MYFNKFLIVFKRIREIFKIHGGRLIDNVFVGIISYNIILRFIEKMKFYLKQLKVLCLNENKP